MPEFFWLLTHVGAENDQEVTKRFCEQEINYVTRIESSSNMEDQSDEDVCFVGIRKMAKNNSNPKLEMAQFQSSLPPVVIDVSLFFRRKKKKQSHQPMVHAAYHV